MIKLKFGQLVSTPQHRSYASNKVLGKLFGCSGSKIRRLYMARFEAIKMKSKPLLDQIRHVQSLQDRQNFGYRYLKPHEIDWLTTGSTLRLQTSMSLVDRCRQFRREFPGSHIHPTLLR